VALGAAEITLQEQVTSYSVFPNDGVRVTPRLIRKVSNADGITLWEDRPEIDEVISQQTARTMMTLFRAVTQHGTGAAVAQLNHPLGGKTGTTSDFTDAWFLGFSPSVTCGVWVGYDSRESLGEKETGARAALPIWMAIMRTAIAGKDNEQFLADQEANPMQEAASQPLAKPGTAPVAGSQAKPVNVNAAAKLPITPANPGTKPPVKPFAKPATKLAVKPPLPIGPAPAKPATAVKPTLVDSSTPARRSSGT
jgi:penicillin-binding protein 1A